MKYLRAVLVLSASATLFLACGHTGGSGSAQATSGNGGGAAAECPPCQQDSDCAAGGKCGQFGGSTYCAPDCSGSASGCSSDRSCTMISGANGEQLSICVPNTNVCGGTLAGSGGSTATSSSTTSSGSSEVCGSLLGPDVMAACMSCKTSGMACQANGCYGGWWCNKDTTSCQAPPSPSSCPGSTTSSSSSSTTSSSSSTSSGSTGPIGPTGGTLPTLSFAIVGDTRPPNDNDTTGYPTAIITKIWQDVQAHSPRPAFGISTGDYMFAEASGSQSVPQLNLYLTARANFTNIVFPAMGNHECTGADASECGQGNPDGITKNYTNFMSQMLTPLGQSLPYYTININGTNNAWTSKFVFIACNAWTSTQSTWLSGELSKPTTYTFVVRHEGSTATTTPCVAPTGTIIAAHPHTLLIAGHTHTYSYYASEKQLIVGNGGAPLSGSVNYGYVIAQQQSDGQILFKSFDYSTNAVVDQFTVSP